MQKRPVIFLAFANDHQNYLYKLTEEQHAVRKALRQVEKEGLCEVVYETDTDLNKIWDTFNEYQERITIFHFGGHAEDYALLLKKANGDSQFAKGEGLVSFLAQQKGLKLVFINGCCSKRQAEELRDRGISAVIGTSEPINDAAATELSEAFYKGLAAGRSLEQAWLGARDLLRSQKNKDGFKRGIVLWDIAGQYTHNFPWDLYTRSGAEHVKQWNLPQAGSNPLFSLPLPDDAFLRLPKAPYVGLHYFREEDAPVFFGRGAQIRALYNHIKGIHPIILLYGKSGVGKSSMLDAGLLPRIKDQYKITYVRRIQERGLLGTLELALNELSERKDSPKEKVAQRVLDRELLRTTAEKVTDEGLRKQIEALLQQYEKEEKEIFTPLSGILNKWQKIEAVSGKPLVVILDQVEEKFTRPMPQFYATDQDELVEFLIAIQPLFSAEKTGIKGKIILSYRKEYHPEIRDAFQVLALPYAEVFLKRLDRDGIIEAIKGSTQYDQVVGGKVRHNTKYNPYRLELESSKEGDLAEIIADDLMEDPDSPIAPVLQIIMEKLWKMTPKVDGEPVKLTIQQYQELRKQGTTMGEFFQQQMAKLNEGNNEAEQERQGEKIQMTLASGLVLDLLYAHTTAMGTADSCSRKDLLQRYDIGEEVIVDLLDRLQELSLLIQSKSERKEGNETEYVTFLAHDTLAPAVILEYNLSDAPGQRAARILKNKMMDIGFRNDPNLIELWKSRKDNGEITAAGLEELAKEQISLTKFLAVNEEILGKEYFEQEKATLIQRAHLNFHASENETILEDADLMVVEIGTGQKDGTSPGMRKLTRPESELLRLSQERRDQRLEAIRIAKEEKERLIAAQLKAEQEAKKQAEENLRNQKRASKRQKVFTGIIGIALFLAIGLGFWASQQRKRAQQNLVEFQNAEANDVRKEILDILKRAKTLGAKKYANEELVLLEKAKDRLEAYKGNPQLNGLRDTVNNSIQQFRNKE